MSYLFYCFLLTIIIQTFTLTLKQSFPFSQVRQNAITLMGSNYSSLIASELQRLEALSQDQIVNYFKNTSYNGDVKLYWFRYYLLTHLTLFENRDWVSPQLEEKGLDENYALFKNKSGEYNTSLQSCRQRSEIFIGDKLHNIEYSYDLLEKFQKDPFYKTLYSDLPKGVIHHAHWSASHNYKAYFEVISSNIQSEPQNDNRTIYLSINVSQEDVTVGGVMNEKSFVKFFLTKYSYLKPENLASALSTNKAALDSFKANYVNGTSCLNFQINKTGFSVDNLDAYLRGFLISQVCSNVVIYDDQLASLNVSGAVNFSFLNDALKNQDEVFETLSKSYNELPQAYLKDNNDSMKNLQILGVWYKFEGVFNGQNEITGDKTNFPKLSDRSFQKLQEQKVVAIELRNKNDSFQMQAFTNSSNKYNIPFSYILPGRKVSGSSNKGASIVSSAEKNRDAKFAGIDFFGFEDDPYNGARNFFPMKLTQILSGDNISNFDRMFKYLDQENGTIILHSGETSYLPTPPITKEYADNNYINDNLFHAALLPGVKRIGHGFVLNQTSLLINIFLARNISLEISPVSNQVLRFVDVNTNPFVGLLRNGLHISISADDPGLFGYEGVANDWYWILKETDLRPEEVYLLLKYSLEHSTVSEIINNQTAVKNQLAEELHSFFKGLPNKCGVGNAGHVVKTQVWWLLSLIILVLAFSE